MQPGPLDRMLVVDLTEGTIEFEAVPRQWRRQYLGGKGLGARYLYDRVEAGVDPLAPGNALVITVGPLTGSLPGDGRFVAVTKSPLTGLFLDSYAGGTFGRSFRGTLPRTAGVVFTGAADDPHLLDLRGDAPSLVPCPELTGETVDTVDSQFDEASVLSVGPAGEAGVYYATIAGDGGDHHAGRGGAGAVMGSKGLKAIIVPRVDDGPLLDGPVRRLHDAILAAYDESAYGDAHRSSGTLESVEFADSTDMLSSFAWQERGFDAAAELGIEAVRRAATERENADEPVPGDFRVESAAGETVIRGGAPIALGANLGLSEFDAVATLGTTCDQLGIDVITGGNAVGLAFLASHQGRIDRHIDFGDEEAAESLLHEIATRSTPLGDLLADGVDRAAAALGLEDAIPTVKAMEVPSFDPRGAPALALAYATSDRGACHRRAVPATAQVFEPRWTPTQTAQAVIAEQNRRAGLWCLIVDDLATPVIGDIGTMWSDALGIDVHRGELDRVGQRTWTLTRLFNVREGAARAEDRLPTAFTESDGIDPAWFDRARRRYYELREWDRHGRPSRRLLERLDLAAVVDDRTPVGGHPLRGP